MSDELVQAEVQCPVCGDMYFRPVKVRYRSVWCRTCNATLFLNYATKVRGGTDYNGSTYIADNLWGKQEFEAMFINGTEKILSEAKSYGFVR